MDCKQCGFNNPEGMRFCGQCATPLDLPCPTCGAINPVDFKFCGQCATSLASLLSTTQTTQSNQSQERAERRQLTVLFCDIVGSSTLSEILDPEELRDLMSEYHAICTDVVSRYDGHIAQYLGDGVLVYFGYPVAHEDSARRAAQAGLDIVPRVSQITYHTQNLQTLNADKQNLQVRVGIHTGLVVVGEISKGDKRSLALGETPNIAARVQDIATAGCVVVSETSHHLLGDGFHCGSLGQHQLKGFSRPLELFQVHNLNPVNNGSIFPAQHSRTRMIGRDTEIQLLLERLEQARKGLGQVVLLSGEPGIGKSRMIQTLYEQIEQDDAFLLECCGTANYRNSYLFPVIDMLRRTFHLHKQLNDKQKLKHIEVRIRSLGLDTTSMIPMLAELLSIPLNDHYSVAIESTPLQKKQQTFDILMTLIQTIAQQRLVFLIVEDLHWIDPSTIELLTQLAGQPGLSNIFALVTFRSEFNASWPSQAHLTRINLNRLTDEQIGLMIYELCYHKTLPKKLVSEIITKTDGIPFFIEELTSALLESGLMEEKVDHFELSTPISELGIPSSLQDLLMSRLDGLGDEKGLAQISAILGREFEHEVLHIISSRDEKSFAQGLDHLINAELFLQHGQRPKAWYSFRHALLREAAYHSLLKRTRQKYHQQIATLLKEQFPQMVKENPELLAHHCTEAGDFGGALEYWLQAGRVALQHSANIEAINHLGEGLAVLAKLPESTQKRTSELVLQTYLGQAYMMTRGYAAPEVEHAYVRAKELCRDISDITTVFPVLCGLWEYYVVRADLETAYPLAEEIYQLAQTTGNATHIIEAHRAMGTTQLWRGQLKDAWQYLQPDTLIENLKGQQDPAQQLSYYQDSRVAMLSNSGCVLWLSGHNRQAIENARQALSLSKRLAHPFSQVYALNFLCILSQLNGDHKTTAEHAELQIMLCKTYGFAFWGAMGKMFLTWANASNEPIEDSLKQFQQSLDDYEKIGSRIARSYFLAMFADLQRSAGNFNAATETIETGLQETVLTGEEFFKSELLRIKGELLLAQAQPSHDAAETVLFQSLEVAREQGAHSLALRIAISLSHLWQKLGKTSQVTELLESQLQLINKDEDTCDQLTARELLKHSAISS